MARITLTVEKNTGRIYLPQSIRRGGFVGRVESIFSDHTIILIRPGGNLATVGKSLRVVLDEISIGIEEIQMNEPNKTQVERVVTPPIHPLFQKYTRNWLSEVTGYSKGYLSRIATGKIVLSRSFVERVCFKLGQSKTELFAPDEGAESK